MKNKKLIRSIKEDVKNQIQSDIKDSVVKELYGSSRKQIKKLKRQVLSEIQEELFGRKQPSKSDTIESLRRQLALLEDSTNNKENSTDIVDTIDVITEKKPFEHGRFKLDVDRMSSLVTGIKKEEEYKLKELTEIEKKDLEKMHKLIGVTKHDKFNIPTAVTDSFRKATDFTFKNPLDFVSTPSYGLTPNKKTFEELMKNLGAHKVEVPKITELTEEKKQEITLFIGKLKKGVSKLKKNERNIQYRKKFDNTYVFSFERKADFDLKFELDINMNTYRAEVNVFEFNVDGFKFDKKLIQLFDIVEILDLVGFNMNGYINEINGINVIDMEKLEAPKANEKKQIRSNTKLEKLINDPKLVILLANNDISNYGQLMKVESLTSLKGIGAKTADKITKELINHDINIK